MNITAHHPTEYNFSILKSCKDDQEARAFMATLSPVERIELIAVSTDLKLGRFYYPNISPQDEPDLAKPTQEHADNVYGALFEMVKSAQETAQRKGEKLQFVVGEIRADRTALMIEAMLVHICRRLGIVDVGVECPPNGELLYPNHEIKFGLKEIQGQIKALPEGRLLSEFGGITATRQRRNLDFIAQLATNQGMNPFPSDPEGLVGDLPKFYDIRAKAIQETLNKKGDCITVHTLNWLEALEKPTPGIHRIIINAANSYSNSSNRVPIPMFKDFTVLTEDRKMAQSIGRGERTGASSLIHVPIDGGLTMARDALQMAQRADINVGEKLAPVQLSAPRARGR